MNFDGSLEPGDIFYSKPVDDHVIIVGFELNVGMYPHYTIVEVYYQKTMKHEKYPIDAILRSIECGEWERI